MGRINRGRILYDGCYAHVFSRASDKRYIFETAQDFEKFRDLLLEAKRRHKFQIHHYCLMNTHFHLVVWMKTAEEFSSGLKWVKWTYTRYFNLRDRRFGPLWRDRFKSLLIENESYMAACGRYVEDNPIEAGMVKKSEDWPYSSSGYYQLGKADALVDEYHFGQVPVITVKEDKEKFFTKGLSIGSPAFRFDIRQLTSV